MIICPVDDMGKNSVIPSTIAMMMLWMRVMRLAVFDRMVTKIKKAMLASPFVRNASL